MSRRAVLVQANEMLEIWDHPVPGPAAGEVLARVQFAGVCGTDVHKWLGDVSLPAPLVLGHEGVAVIEELGDDVTTDFAGTPVARGDRISWAPVRPCYRCYQCTVQRELTQCANFSIPVRRGAAEPPLATYSELALLQEGVPFFRIPGDTPSEAVIAFGCAMPTMLMALERLGGIAKDQNVVIQGCGPVGLAATLLARISGADEVVVIGAPKRRLEMAMRLGASATIDLDEVGSQEERAHLVRELLGDRGADVVIEAAGAVRAFTEGLHLAAKSGRYLVVGLWSAPGSVPIEPRYVNNMNLQIIGSAFYEPRHLYGAIQIARRYHLQFPMVDVITHRYALDDSQQALEAVANLDAVKAVILPNG